MLTRFRVEGEGERSSMAENDDLGIERTASIQNPTKPSSSIGARVRATHDDDEDEVRVSLRPVLPHSSSDLIHQEAARALSVMDSFHQPWLTGVELLDDANRNKHVLPTGLEGIDVLLGGGLREGQLIEIAGPSSSGKTQPLQMQVCLHSASCIADKGSVMFLDTCNSFSPNRIACMVNQFSGPLFKEAKERRLERIMSSILCQPIYDIFELLDTLHQLESTLKHTVKTGGYKICLLIIDSISSLIAPILGGKSPQGRLLMVSAGIVLKKLAHEFNLAVLVTNHMVGGEGGIIKPALGESWKNIPHVRLVVSRDQQSNVFTATVLKHTMRASGRTAKFVIHN
ncbi:DNA repair protein RAD51 homolog 4 isoform X2 [Ananas comosus]|uniref:DNA repair protein RAD51 homolog 4 isoform X2 n=1 Tax=Ananas comosus TaxID=4615 RepID=A0A6P5FZL4_ANACO|nr:DNA repair protein RAD51 homolog 4 isoform X2 [Ananas comosus]XP_020101807.1 DNA repair protein RAD51 homolog 4 isoform X2 [Ananas comosus]